MDEETRFNRQTDFENLNKIPKLETKIDLLSEAIGEIKTSIKSVTETYPVVKSNTEFLMGAFKWVIMSVIGTVILAVLGMVIRK
jgi:hypothetical protein